MNKMFHVHLLASLRPSALPPSALHCMKLLIHELATWNRDLSYVPRSILARAATYRETKQQVEMYVM